MLLLYHLSAFKSSLGTFLDKVPDMPPTGQSGVNNNSLLDWARQNFQNSKTHFVAVGSIRFAAASETS